MMTTAASLAILATMITSWPDGHGAAPRVVVSYEDQRSLERCDTERHHRAMAGHVAGFGIAMFCFDKPEGWDHRIENTDG